MADRVYPRTLKDGTTKVWDAIVHIPNPATGKRKQVQKTFKTQREAKRWVGGQQGAVANGTAVLPSALTVSELLDYWLDHHIRHQRSPKTFVDYEGTVRLHIKPMLGRIKIQKLTADRLQRFCTDKLDEGSGKRTVELSHMNMSQALDQAVALGWVTRNVADVVKPPRWKTRELEVWTVEEAMQFLSVATRESVHGPLWLLALTKGLRKGELLGLRWEDVDLDRGVLRVRQTIGALHGKYEIKRPKTPKSERDLDLREGVLAALRAHKDRQNAHRQEMGPLWQEQYGLVFPNAYGRPLDPSNMDRDFERLVKRAGVKKIRVHDLRHTYATLALATGESIKVVSETLGHADVALTLRVYVHTVPEQRRALADKMETLLLDEKTG